MNETLSDLETNISSTLKHVVELKNQVERIENQKLDQLRDISTGIIDILDSIEMIQERYQQKGLDGNDEVSKVNARYLSVQKKLILLLQKHGITKMEFPENRLIVGWCEVTETEPDPNKSNDEIISILRQGYIRGKEVIRSAQIITVKN